MSAQESNYHDDKTKTDSSLYYTIQDIMSIFNISKNTAYRLAKTDGVPCMKLGNTIRFEKEAFDVWRKRNLNKSVVLW